MGSRPHGKGNFGELFGPLKYIGSLCCGVCSETNHSIPSNGMTADCNAADWSVSHFVDRREKCTPCDAAFCHKSLTTCSIYHGTAVGWILCRNQLTVHHMWTWLTAAVTYLACNMPIQNISYCRRTAQCSKSVELLSSAAKMYEKLHLKRLAIDEWPWWSLIQGHRNCRCSIEPEITSVSSL